MRSRYLSNRSGILLRRRVLPAGDLLVVLLSPQGKVRAIARGGMRGSLASRLNLFCHVNVQLSKAPNEDLASIKQAVLEGALPTLAQPERHPYAHLMAEVADTLVQEGEQHDREQAFELLAAALRGVAHHEDPEWVALVMVHKLLAHEGLLPKIHECAQCAAPRPFHPDPVGGQLLCGNCSQAAAYPPALLDFLYHIQARTIRIHMEKPLIVSERKLLWTMLEKYFGMNLEKILSISAIKAALPAIQS